MKTRARQTPLARHRVFRGLEGVNPVNDGSPWFRRFRVGAQANQGGSSLTKFVRSGPRDSPRREVGVCLAPDLHTRVGDRGEAFRRLCAASGLWRPIEAAPLRTSRPGMPRPYIHTIARVIVRVIRHAPERHGCGPMWRMGRSRDFVAHGVARFRRARCRAISSRTVSRDFVAHGVARFRRARCGAISSRTVSRDFVAHGVARFRVGARQSTASRAQPALPARPANFVNRPIWRDCLALTRTRV
jgi:hypothetical protein